MIQMFKVDQNYIGNMPWMYKFTQKISELYPEINFTAFKHDNHYAWILAESNIILRLVLKIMYDLIFLILGILRNLVKFRPDAVPIMICLWIVLLISTPWYLYITKNKQIDLTRL